MADFNGKGAGRGPDYYGPGYDPNNPQNPNDRLDPNNPWISEEEKAKIKAQQKTAPIENTQGLKASYDKYIETYSINAAPGLDNPNTGKPFTYEEWQQVRQAQTIDERKAQNVAIEYTPHPKSYITTNVRK